MRRAKIVCTLGPATSSYEQIRKLVDAGMDVARLNLSHGTHADHEQTYTHVRRASDESGRAVGILADLQGPKIRLGTFADGPVSVEPGDTFTITTREVEGDATICSTTYEGLPGDVESGDMVLIDDGNVRLTVTGVTDTDVECRVEVAGELSNHKGINLPGAAVSVPAMTDKDIADLRWALRQRVDIVALSFVRSADDAALVRNVMAEEDEFIPVIAKIEKPQAIDNIDAIIETFDGIMVARGDLGVEMPLEEVPLLQKDLIARTRAAAKPVVVATQMLESMISAPRPTRAEASDVANAVLDGTDAVMLSGETSVGEYPIETVETMSKIAANTEEQGLHLVVPSDSPPANKSGIIAKSACEIAAFMEAKFIIAFTTSGDTVRRMARHRPDIPMLAFTPEPVVRSQLALVWGVETFLVPDCEHTDEMAMQVDEHLLAAGYCQEGDPVVIVAGSPPGIPGSTNAVRVHMMGDAKNAVAPAYQRDATP